MIIATSHEIAEKRIIRTLGMVRGNSIRGRHMGRDLIAHLRNAVGGEITEYTKMLAEAREQALEPPLDRRLLDASGERQQL